jgi:hypothetical protein
MKLPRRQFLHLAAGAAALSAASRIASAQAYPTRSVRIVVGYAAGGTSDIVGRLVGQWLSERLGQQFIVENRPGASANLATEAVARATADGYTLLVVTSVGIDRSVGLGPSSRRVPRRRHFHHQQPECSDGESWSQLPIQIWGGRLLIGEVATKRFASPPQVGPFPSAPAAIPTVWLEFIQRG